MQKETINAVQASIRAVRQVPYFSMPATALIPIAMQFCIAGGKNEDVGREMALGIYHGLKTEAQHQFPVCPHCGQRHPPNLQRFMAAFARGLMSRMK